MEREGKVGENVVLSECHSNERFNIYITRVSCEGKLSLGEECQEQTVEDTHTLIHTETVMSHTHTREDIHELQTQRCKLFVICFC